MLRALRILVGLPLVLFLSGCLGVDSYSLRAVDYNLEAEQSKNQVILLNIARSHLHRPMQFTEIQTLVGSNSAQSEYSFSFPVFNPSKGPVTGTAGGNWNNSTNFTVPVLDTQEFYQGLLSTIPVSLLAYYLQTPLPKDLLFNLVVEQIVVQSVGCRSIRRHSARCERDFRNNPDKAEDIALFQTFVNYLRDLQPSIEPLPEEKSDKVIKTAGATINISSDKGSGDGGSAGFRLCFNPRRENLALSPSALCGSADKSGHAKVKSRIDLVDFPFTDDLRRRMEMVIDATDPADELEYKNSVRAFAAQRYVHVTLKLRSTAAIFGYLGQLIQSAKEGRVIALEAPVFHRRFEIPCWITDPEDLTCRPIFLASAPALPPPLVTVVYAGSVYSVPGDPATSFSPDVMALLKQLLALNLSAKSLPATATLSLTGPIR